MIKETKRSQQQKAEIYCIDHGHANYVWKFFGYVHCGRCGQQIGDQLGSIFNTTNLIVVGHKCKMCDSLKKKLSSLDKKIITRLEKIKSATYDYTKVLEGIVFK